MTILGSERLRLLESERLPSQQESFLGYLQWTREGMQRFPFAIVLWVTYQLQGHLSRKAPDFWSWRRDVVRFVSSRQRVPPAAQPFLREEEVQQLSQSERRKLIFVEKEEVQFLLLDSEPISFSSSRGQFSPPSTMENMLSIEDLESLIKEADTALSGEALLTDLYLQAGEAYMKKVEMGLAEDDKRVLEQAEYYLAQAVELIEPGSDRKSYARSLDKLARVYELQKRDDEADELYAKAVAIKTMC